MNKRRKINLILGTGGSIIAGVAPVGLISMNSGEETSEFNHFTSEIIMLPSDFGGLTITNVGTKKYNYEAILGSVNSVDMFYKDRAIAENISKILMYYENKDNPAEKFHKIIVDTSSRAISDKIYNNHASFAWRKSSQRTSENEGKITGSVHYFSDGSNLGTNEFTVDDYKWLGNKRWVPSGILYVFKDSYVDSLPGGNTDGLIGEREFNLNTGSTDFSKHRTFYDFEDDSYFDNDYFMIDLRLSDVFNEFSKTVNKSTKNELKLKYDEILNNLDNRYNSDPNKESKINEFLGDLKSKYNAFDEIWKTIDNPQNIIRYNINYENQIQVRNTENNEDYEYITDPGRAERDLNEVKQKFEELKTQIEELSTRLRNEDHSESAEVNNSEEVVPSEELKNKVKTLLNIPNNNWSINNTWSKVFDDSLLKGGAKDTYWSNNGGIQNLGLSINSSFRGSITINNNNEIVHHSLDKSALSRELISSIFKYPEGGDTYHKPLIGANIAKILANSGYIKDEFKDQIKDYDFKFIGKIESNNFNINSEDLWRVNAGDETKLAKFLIFTEGQKDKPEDETDGSGVDDDSTKFVRFVKDYNYDSNPESKKLLNVPGLWIIARESLESTNFSETSNLYGLKIPVRLDRANGVENNSTNYLSYYGENSLILPSRTVNEESKPEKLISYLGKSIVESANNTRISKVDKYKYSQTGKTVSYFIKLWDKLPTKYTNTPNDLYIKYQSKDEPSKQITIKLKHQENIPYFDGNNWKWDDSKDDNNTSLNNIYMFSDNKYNSAAKLKGWFYVLEEDIKSSGGLNGETYDPIEIGWLDKDNASTYHMYNLNEYINKEDLNSGKLSISLSNSDSYKELENTINNASMQGVLNNINSLKEKVNQYNKQNDPTWTGYLSDIESKYNELSNIFTTLNSADNDIRRINLNGDNVGETEREIINTFDTIRNKFTTLKSLVEEKLSEVETNNEAMVVKPTLTNFYIEYNKDGASWSGNHSISGEKLYYTGEKWYLTFNINRDYLKQINLDSDDSQVKVQLYMVKSDDPEEAINNNADAIKVNVNDSTATIKVEITPDSVSYGAGTGHGVLTINKIYIGNNEENARSERIELQGEGRNLTIDMDPTDDFHNFISALYGSDNVGEYGQKGRVNDDSRSTSLIDVKVNEIKELLESMVESGDNQESQINQKINEWFSQIIIKNAHLKEIALIPTTSQTHYSRNPEVIAKLNEWKSSIEPVLTTLDNKLNELSIHKRKLDHLTEEIREFKENNRDILSFISETNESIVKLKEIFDNNLENYKSLPSSQESTKISQMEDSLIKWKEFVKDLREINKEYIKVKNLIADESNKLKWWNNDFNNNNQLLLIDETKLSVSNNIVDNKSQEYTDKYNESFNKLKLLKQKFGLLDLVKNEPIKPNQLEELINLIEGINVPTNNDQDFGANVKEKLNEFKEENARENTSSQKGYSNLVIHQDTSNASLVDYRYSGVNYQIKVLVQGDIDFSFADKNKVSVILSGANNNITLIGTFEYNTDSRILTVNIPFDELLEHKILKDVEYTIAHISEPHGEVQEENITYYNVSNNESKLSYSYTDVMNDFVSVYDNKENHPGLFSAIEAFITKGKESGFDEQSLKGFLEISNVHYEELTSIKAKIYEDNNLIGYVDNEKAKSAIREAINKLNETDPLLTSAINRYKEFTAKSNELRSKYNEYTTQLRKIHENKNKDNVFYQFIESVMNTPFFTYLPNITKEQGNNVENEQLVVILKKYLDDVKLIIDKIKNVKDKINNSVALKLNLSDKLDELLSNYPSLIAEIDTFAFKENSVSEYNVNPKYTDLFNQNIRAINLLNAQSDLANLVLFEMKLDEDQKQELIKDIKNITVYENDESFGSNVKEKMQEFLNKQNVDESKDAPEDKKPEETSPDKGKESSPEKDNKSNNKTDENNNNDKVMSDELKQNIVEFKNRIDKYIKDPKLLSYYSERLEKLTSEEEFNLLLAEYENDVKEGKINEKVRWYDNTGAFGSLITFGVFSVAALILSGVMLVIKKVKSK